jgi:AcrR family transcriptional regulator
MRDIAGAASVSLATVHHYFGSKEELYRASVASMYEELQALRDELTEAIMAGGSFDELVDEIVRRSYRFARAHRAAVVLTLREVLDTGEVPEERRTGFLLPFLDEGAALLAAQTGRPAEQVRLTLHCLHHVIVRYAITADREVSLITNKRGAKAGNAAIEDQIVWMARQLLGPLHPAEA